MNKPLFLALFLLTACFGFQAAAEDVPVQAQAISPAAAPLVILDPAYSEFNPGVNAGDFSENRYTLLLAKSIEKYLSAQGLRVHLTRVDSTGTKLETRIENANAASAAAFIALQVNSSFEDNSRGLRIFAPAGSLGAASDTPLTWKNSQRNSSAKSMALANELARQLEPSARRTKTVQILRLAHFRGLAVPAAVLAMGFASHPADLETMKDAQLMEGSALAIAQAVVSFLKRPWIEMDAAK